MLLRGTPWSAIASLRELYSQTDLVELAAMTSSGFTTIIALVLTLAGLDVSHAYAAKANLEEQAAPAAATASRAKAAKDQDCCRAGAGGKRNEE